MLLNGNEEVVFVRILSCDTKMKQILPKLKELDKHLTFARSAFTKCGFRHVTHYLNGLITLNKKTIKQISAASIEENHHSAINRVLTEAHFEQERLEVRYLKKIEYLTRGQEISLLFDDTLAERDGPKVEEAQNHYNHSNEEFIRGHQFFTSLIYTPILQLPLFPRLYSKNTDSKIEMADDLIEKIMESIHLYSVIFDSWYSDKKLINKCITKGVKVVCAIKTNRSISQEKGKWQNLAEFSNSIDPATFENYFIDEQEYQLKTFNLKLKGVSTVKLMISRSWEPTKKGWGPNFHLISTNIHDTPVQIIRQYSIRWCIETYHRDIKQNLGFAKAHLRKAEGIVRHAIFVSLAYAILRLFMFYRRMDMTIGECCAYIQDKGMDDFVREIVEIEDRETRIDYFEEVFIRRTAKV